LQQLSLTCAHLTAVFIKFGIGEWWRSREVYRTGRKTLDIGAAALGAEIILIEFLFARDARDWPHDPKQAQPQCRQQPNAQCVLMTHGVPCFLLMGLARFRRKDRAGA
jgi:hypothetical protein